MVSGGQGPVSTRPALENDENQGTFSQEEENHTQWVGKQWYLLKLSLSFGKFPNAQLRSPLDETSLTTPSFTRARVALELVPPGHQVFETELS